MSGFECNSPDRQSGFSEYFARQQSDFAADSGAAAGGERCWLADRLPRYARQSKQPASIFDENRPSSGREKQLFHQIRAAERRFGRPVPVVAQLLSGLRAHGQRSKLQRRVQRHAYFFAEGYQRIPRRLFKSAQRNARRKQRHRLHFAVRHSGLADRFRAGTAGLSGDSHRRLFRSRRPSERPVHIHFQKHADLRFGVDGFRQT